MAPPPASAKRRLPSLRAGFLRPAMVLAGGCFVLGSGAAFLAQNPSTGILLLLIGGLIALVGVRYLWRTWTELDTLVKALSQAADLSLLPTDTPLAPDSPLTPVTALLTTMVTNVRHLVLLLQRQADEVRNGAIQIGTATEGHNFNAAGQAAAISQVAAAMRELEHTIGQVTTNIHEVALAADQVAAASISSRDVAAAAADSVEDTRRQVAATLTAIEIFRDRAGQIGALSALIGEVADHTHILALNAAIEAAGAGTDGPALRRGRCRSAGAGAAHPRGGSAGQPVGARIGAGYGGHN